jgi:hypothetical protein
MKMLYEFDEYGIIDCNPDDALAEYMAKFDLLWCFCSGGHWVSFPEVSNPEKVANKQVAHAITFQDSLPEYVSQEYKSKDDKYFAEQHPLWNLGLDESLQMKIWIDTGR